MSGASGNELTDILYPIVLIDGYPAADGCLILPIISCRPHTILYSNVENASDFNCLSINAFNTAASG